MAWNWPTIVTTVDKLNQLYDLVSVIYADVKTLRQQQETKMAISDIEAAVSRQGTVVDRAIELLERLSAELKAAIAAQDPAALQALADQIDANTQRLADAVAAGSPPPPTP